MSPLTGLGKNSAFTILQTFRTYGAVPNFDGVPPLAEQKRIVARVEQLLRWCDTLKAQVHQTRTLGAHLLDAFIGSM